MAKIVVNTTFRDFCGNANDKMQIYFLKSLKRQTMQDFILVVTIFNERNVEKAVRSVMKDKCIFIYDKMEGNYKFSLSNTFVNGIDYGLKSDADILLDCSSDVILQSDFLEVISKRCQKFGAGISHPNIFMNRTQKEKIIFERGKISRGIDARYFSMDIFKDGHIRELIKKYPSYDYGAGIESQLCSLGIKYAKKCSNIYMESKVIKMENDRGGNVGKVSAFMLEGRKRNIPTVMRFLQCEGLPRDYLNLKKINTKYKVTKYALIYKLIFIKEILEHNK